MVRRNKTQQIKHSFAPDRGLAQNLPPTLINERQMPNCNNLKFRFGEFSKAPGYTEFASDSSPLSNDGSAGQRVMALIHFKDLGGATSYLALTLDDAFVYDSTKFRWRAMGTLVEDCEDAWTAAANVTDASDTGKVGTNCRKLTVAAAYTPPGTIAYEVTALGDLSARNRVHFWIKCSVAQGAGDIILRFSNAADLSTDQGSVNVPALAAGTWYYLSLTIDLSAANSVDSVGLVSAAGFDDTCDIWIDDIRASTAFTGSKDDQWTWCSQAGAGTSQETAPTWFLMATNGIDAPFKWLSSDAAFTAITGTLGTGNLTKSKVAISYKDTLHLMNNTENSNVIPQRDRFGDTAEEDGWTAGVADFVDCYDTPGEILAASILGPYLVVYKDDGILLLEYNAAATPVIDKTPRITNSQFFATKAIGSANNIDYFLARDNAYIFTGLHEAQPIGDPIRDTLIGNLDYNKKSECFAFIEPSKHRITFVTPQKADATYTHWYCYDFQDRTWSMGTYAHYITCAGLYEGGATLAWDQASGAWSAAIGTWEDRPQETQDKSILLGDKDGYTWQLSDAVKTYGGTAIDAEGQTKDFALPPDHQERQMRFGKLMYAARGDLITVSYSTDEGATWTAISTNQQLYSERKNYAIPLNFSANKARFKFHDATDQKTFFVSWVAVEYIASTTRT